MKKVSYIRCPRCELNYITKDEGVCSICKQEMKVGGGLIDELEMELCPICKNNYIQPDEVMCASCYEERVNDPNFDEDSAEWNKYINPDEEDNMDYSQEEFGDMATVKSLDEMDDLDDDDLDDDMDLDDDLDVMVGDEDKDDLDDLDMDEMDDDDDDYFDDDDDDYDDEEDED